MTDVADVAATAVAPAKLQRAHPARAVLRRALGTTRMRIGIAVTLIPVAIALLGPLFAPYSPTELVGRPFADPSSAALLGTDEVGRDVLSRVLWGGRSVLWMALAAATIGVGGGVIIGMIAGYSRNWVDSTLMRALEVIMAFPNIVLVFLFVSMVGSEPWLIVMLVGIGWVPSVARVIRGVTLHTVERDFIEAVEVLGASRRRILLSEVLPNLTAPVMVEFGLRLTWAIAMIAALSFVGFGVQPPNADWGLMINENRSALAFAPLATLVPVACIATFTVGTNLMTEAIGRGVAGVGVTARGAA